MGKVRPLLLLASITWFSYAQEAEVTPEPTPTPSPYQVQIRFYTWPVRGILHDGMDSPALPTTYLPGETGPQRVLLSRGGLSAPHRYSGSVAPVLIHAEKTGTHPETGAPIWTTRPLARPDIPRDWRECVVVLFPGSTRSDDTWQTLPLRAGELNLPTGGSRFLNTSRQQLVVDVDGDRRPLPAGESFLQKSGSGSDRVRLRIYGRNPVHGRAELVYTSSHWRKENTGNLYVIYNASPTRLKVLQISPEENDVAATDDK